MLTVGVYTTGIPSLNHHHSIPVPGATPVAHQIIMLLDLWVGMSGQHLAMGVHIDAGALCLLEQCFQITHIMTSDQYGLAFFWSSAHLGGLGDAKVANMGTLEELHHAQVGLAQVKTLAQHHIGIIGISRAQEIVILLVVVGCLCRGVETTPRTQQPHTPETRQQPVHHVHQAPLHGACRQPHP